MAHVTILKLTPTNNKIKSKEDVLMANLIKFYNEDMNHVKTLIYTVIKRNKKKNKITYASSASEKQLQDFIKDNKVHVSLRVLDWCVTNYTKKKDTSYFVKTTNCIISNPCGINTCCSVKKPCNNSLVNCSIDNPCNIGIICNTEHFCGIRRFRHFFVHRNYKSQLKSYQKDLFDPFCRRSRIILVDPFGNQLQTTVAQLNFFRWMIQNDVICYTRENKAVIEADMKKYQSATNSDTGNNKR